MSTAKEHFENAKRPFGVFIGILSLVAISFTIGIFYGQKWQQEPLILIPDNNHTEGVKLNDEAAGVQNEPLEGIESTFSSEKEVDNCLYVGSKTGSKYYPPTCSFAGRVKPENLRCFASDDDAVEKGYERSTAC